ncbi:hypothetical protein ACIP6T_13145 [Pantoea sp. NPDC088449]
MKQELIAWMNGERVAKHLPGDFPQHIAEQLFENSMRMLARLKK